MLERNSVGDGLFIHLAQGNFAEQKIARFAFTCFTRPISTANIRVRPGVDDGHFAGLAVLEAMRSPHARVSTLAAYQRHSTEITQALDHAKRLRYLIFPSLSERLLVKMLPRSATLTRKHLDLMADEIGYGDYARYIGTRAIKGLVSGRFF